MTNEETRELDREIALLVFKMIAWEKDGEWYLWHKDDPISLPAYSSPSGFFLLLEKLIADGWMFEIRSPYKGRVEGVGQGYWGIVIFHPEKHPSPLFGSYSDLPLGLALMVKAAYSKPEKEAQGRNSEVETKPSA